MGTVHKRDGPGKVGSTSAHRARVLSEEPLIAEHFMRILLEFGIFIKCLPFLIYSEFVKLPFHQIYLKISTFAHAAPKLYNELPLSIRQSARLNVFKANLKTHFFKLAYESELP